MDQDPDAIHMKKHNEASGNAIDLTPVNTIATYSHILVLYCIGFILLFFVPFCFWLGMLWWLGGSLKENIVRLFPGSRL